MSMISPEIYYEEYLKDKSEKEILSAIRGLKNEMGHLKNVMEDPDYQSMMCPSELTKFKCTRAYFERAKQALSDVGGEYKLSKPEISAQEFQENLDSVTKIVLEIGGFFQDNTIYKAEINEDVVNISKESLFMISPPAMDTDDEEEPYSKQEFLELFADLHIGEWRKHYSTERFGISVLDGTQWSLDIYYNNGKKASYDGSNSYPYNFCDLKELFGLYEMI